MSGVQHPAAQHWGVPPIGKHSQVIVGADECGSHDIIHYIFLFQFTPSALKL